MSKFNKTDSNLTEEQKLKLQQEKAQLKAFLTSSPDELIKRKGRDEYLDQKNEKLELSNGRLIDLKGIDAFISKAIQEYGVKFHQPFYREVFRLKGWKIPANNIIVHKPSIVGKYTIDYIYGRFPREIFPELRERNGLRLHKHFQLLTSEGQKGLEIFIQDAIIIMKRCTTWAEFVNEHAKDCGLPFQRSLFDKE